MLRVVNSLRVVGVTSRSDSLSWRPLCECHFHWFTDIFPRTKGWGHGKIGGRSKTLRRSLHNILGRRGAFFCVVGSFGLFSSEKRQKDKCPDLPFLGVLIFLGLFWPRKYPWCFECLQQFFSVSQKFHWGREGNKNIFFRWFALVFYLNTKESKIGERKNRERGVKSGSGWVGFGGGVIQTGVAL